MYLWIFLRGPVTFLGVLRVLTAITRITHISFTYSIHYLPPFKATSAGLLTPYTTHCHKRTPLRPGTKLAVNWPESTATPETAKEDKEICYSLKRERYAIVLRMSWNHICYATRRKMKVGKFVFSE